MQQIVVESTVVAASPEVVWAYICDIPAMPRWRAGVESVEWIGDGSSPTPGRQFTVRWLPDRRTKNELATVVDSVPARSFGFTVRRGQVEFRFLTVELSDGDTRCQITLVDTPGRFSALRGGDVAALIHERREALRDMLASIKRDCETTAGRPVGVEAADRGTSRMSVRSVARRNRPTLELERRKPTPKWQRRL